MRAPLALVLLSIFACDPKEPVTIGAACSATEKIEACAVGKSAVCVAGKWEASLICPSGCVRKTMGHGSTVPICADAVARAGMVCTTWRSHICSDDGHAQLVCEGGRWKMEKACATSCSFPASGIVCK